MVSEIYTRSPLDINYELSIETNNDIEAILGQIRMILGTKPTEVLGSSAFGIDLNHYLFNFGVDINVIKKQLLNHITQYMKYDNRKYTIDVDVKYGQSHDGSGDYALIDIVINQNKCMGVIVAQ